jgi:hypothetical protein
MVSYQEFDTPDAIQRWFEETVDIDVNGEKKQLKKNYYAYLYGIGKIMKTKQELLTKSATDLGKQISKINIDYNSGISETGNILPQLIPGDPDIDKKSKLVDSVVSDVNDTYKTQYFELIQKKIRYDEAITKLISRRNYLVASFNEAEDGYQKIVNENILPRAQYIFEKYHGTRYREIRRLLFVFIPICAFFPEVIEKSFILNTSITGPAGSGKTTLARILSKWYNAVGFLTGDPYLETPNEAYREVGRAELVAQYVGQTAPRTMGVLYSTLEKTLFIDEAYSVAGCSFDKSGKLDPDAYGEEFLSTLLPFIANHQGIGSVIVAGYKNLMEICFFKRND